MDVRSEVHRRPGGPVEFSALMLIGMARAIGVSIPPDMEEDVRAELRQYRLVRERAGTD